MLRTIRVQSFLALLSFLFALAVLGLPLQHKAKADPVIENTVDCWGEKVPMAFDKKSCEISNGLLLNEECKPKASSIVDALYADTLEGSEAAWYLEVKRLALGKAQLEPAINEGKSITFRAVFNNDITRMVRFGVKRNLTKRTILKGDKCSKAKDRNSDMAYIAKLHTGDGADNPEIAERFEDVFQILKKKIEQLCGDLPAPAAN